MIKQLDWSEWKLDEFSYNEDVYSCVAITGDFYHVLVKQNNNKFRYIFRYRFIEPGHYPIEEELRYLFLSDRISDEKDAKDYIYSIWVETVKGILL